MFSFLGLIPALFTSAIQIVTPIVVALVQVLLWWLRQLWDGIRDILDSLATVVTVLSLCLATGIYGYAQKTCAPCPKPAVTKTIKPKPGTKAWWDDQKWGKQDKLPPLIKPGRSLFG